jgi:predicted RNase H-like nuclease (RuvC/YqgF family)
MLGGLFPNLFGGESGATSLSTGGKPENLNGDEKNNIANYSNLPTKITQQDISKAARLAGELEAQTVLLKHGSEQYLNVQQAALANLEQRVNHAQKSMQNTQQFQRKMAKHGKNIYEFQTGSEATKQNFDAYEQQFNSIKVDI